MIKVNVINREISKTYQPKGKNIVIRMTSEDYFVPMEYAEGFVDIIELQFDDISPTHPKEDWVFGPMTTEHYQQIKDFVMKHKESIDHLTVHCDAGQSRSPGIALGIVDYILEDHEQAIELLKKNPVWKPNVHMISFFKEDYYSNYYQ